jgi:hypothetical protein
MMSDPLTVYISGRVTGEPREGTIKKFEKAAALLHANNMKCINPMEHTLEGDTWAEAMAKLIPLLCRNCDAILMLEDWEYSEGSMIEYQIAKGAKMTVLFEEDFN